MFTRDRLPEPMTVLKQVEGSGHPTVPNATAMVNNLQARVMFTGRSLRVETRIDDGAAPSRHGRIGLQRGARRVRDREGGLTELVTKIGGRAFAATNTALTPMLLGADS